ncbi:MAG: endonuclease [Candidatus Diapherotrites archaeon]|nr:endonuclease [Candidatus Diapherotrites archaeon]
MFEIIVLLIIIFLLSALSLVLYRRISILEQRLSHLSSEKQSQSTRYGLLVEQWLPLSEQFPFSPENFRFLGSPVDGIAFENDRIIFCEFKLNNSKLTEREKRIKELVENGKVEWFELSAGDSNK